ncbi:hypothetical protein [Flavobacterium sp. 1355]|uniref:hypothetical protein n=1 Tax=Flavobacterium sp. 1355 TaxID=2806571 RepID=UPI001AE4C54A|nr:hypothetical protein [Flavobacterium sp. 1355]MBP1222586.1 hypothetical protein [Flavobacterium sp. 1355]
MGKKNILICDNKRVFVKMFKKKFNKEFEFTDAFFMEEEENKIKNFDRLIFVVYNKFELIEFLKLYKEGTDILVCVFNKQLYNSLSFLEEFNNLFLLDGSKTRKEIIIDLRTNFKNGLHFKQQFSESMFPAYSLENQTFTSLKTRIMSSVV